jgi:Transposase zinc-ribbon domain
MPSRDQFFAALGSLPAAVALLTALRWPDGVTCPHCGSAACRLTWFAAPFLSR